MISASRSFAITIQTAINNAKPWRHQQPFVPTWAVRSRASFFPSEPQPRNLKQYHLTIIEETHSASLNRTRGGETMECSVGVDTAPRLQSWQAASYVLFASPFFHTVARVRHLDPRTYITVRAQGCVHCKTKPIIELSVRLEKQISTQS